MPTLRGKALALIFPCDPLTSICRTWAIWDNGVYDLTDYLNTVSINQGATALYSFLDDDIVHLFMSQAGQDITKQMTKLLATKNSSVVTANTNCLNRAFYIGRADFRDTPRCLVQNYLLLVFSIVLVTSMVLKCTPIR
jgi:chitin synthase